MNGRTARPLSHRRVHTRLDGGHRRGPQLYTLAVRRIVRSAADLPGAEPAPEDAQQIRLDAEAEDALLPELGVDEVRDLRVRLGQLAPVQAGALVVRRVKPV